MRSLNEVFAQARVSGEVTAEDALDARRAAYGSGAPLSPDRIETLLRIDEAADRAHPAWQALLIEAGVDYLVHEREPIDVIDHPKADWLVDRIATDGRIRTAREFELLVRILETARSVPEALIVFALKQVRAAVVDGDGPLAGTADADPGRITREETDLVRRILFAAGGTGAGDAISRAEAEVIFDINDAALAANNDPRWPDLFVKAVANCVMAASGYHAPPRHVALAAEHRPNGAPTTDGGGFFIHLTERLRGILDLYTPAHVLHWETPLPEGDEEHDPESVDRSHAVWLARRIARDGVLDENEKALLRFIRDEARSVHPALRELITQAA
jgi:hypothetical protein